MGGDMLEECASLEATFTVMEQPLAIVDSLKFYENTYSIGIAPYRLFAISVFLEIKVAACRSCEMKIITSGECGYAHVPCLCGVRLILSISGRNIFAVQLFWVLEILVAIKLHTAYPNFGFTNRTIQSSIVFSQKTILRYGEKYLYRQTDQLRDNNVNIASNFSQ